MKALDVGSGSGYLTACFAQMVKIKQYFSFVVIHLIIPIFHAQVGETGYVVGIDHVDELIKWSEENVRKEHSSLLDSNRIKFVGKFKKHFLMPCLLNWSF